VNHGENLAGLGHFPQCFFTGKNQKTDWLGGAIGVKYAQPTAVGLEAEMDRWNNRKGRV
jgi:hypothetical protein